jgi:AcrR family transcriptional regulator
VATSRAQKKPSLIEEVRRRQIVDTAIRTIASRGFAHTTLNDIAEEAGVSTGVITYHFRNKDDLIEESIKKLFQAPNDYVIGRVNEQVSFADKLRAYIDATIRFMVDNRDHSVALIYSFSSISSQEERQRIIARHHAKIRKFLAKILQGGQDAGEFGKFDAAILSQIIFGALEGLVTQWVLDPGAMDLDKSSRQLVQMVERHVAPN